MFRPLPIAPTAGTMSQPLRWAFGYSATAPALLYLLHPCSRMPSADFCLNTPQITLHCAIGFHLFAFIERWHQWTKTLLYQSLTG